MRSRVLPHDCGRLARRDDAIELETIFDTRLERAGDMPSRAKDTRQSGGCLLDSELAPTAAKDKSTGGSGDVTPSLVSNRVGVAGALVVDDDGRE